MDFDDCSFIVENKSFRLRACGILIDEGKVLVVGNEQSPYFYSLGGAVHVGETTKEAAIREVFEETGHIFEIERLAFIHENFFEWEDEGTYKNSHMHEIAFYYLMKWDPAVGSLRPGVTMDSLPEQLHWLEIDDLADSKIPIFPTFFAKELMNLSDSVVHIITHE